MAVLELVLDNGISKTDKITNDGRIKVSGIEEGSTWQWSADNGANWSNALRERSGVVELSGDGAQSLSVKTTSKAGAESTSRIDFVLDTFVAAAYASQAGNYEGENTGLKGSAEKGAMITVRRGSEILATVKASAEDGSWSLPLAATVKISGLTKVDGSAGSANGTYTLLSRKEAQGLVDQFSKDLAPEGKSLLDTSRTAFKMLLSSTIEFAMMKTPSMM